MKLKNNGERIKISRHIDVAEASSVALRLGELAGFSHTKRYMVATAVSELGTNISRYARDGEITIRIIENGNIKGIEIAAADRGAGITDLEAAMKDSFSTSNSLGLGLPGVKRMMDEFEIETEQGTGTHIVVRKWIK